jgi:hypothetical protein
MTAFTGWTQATAPAVDVSSPLADVVANLPLSDDGVNRLEIRLTGETMANGTPMKSTLDAIANSDETFTKQVDGEPVEISVAEAQARAVIRELYRAAGQLQKNREPVYVRARRAAMRDGSQVVQAWRASAPSQRGRKPAGNGDGDQDGEE